MTDPHHAARRHSPWALPVRLEDVPESGRHVDLRADETTCAALAEFIGVRAVPSAEASFDLAREGRDGLQVTGEVRARVGQTCVVSLEPMESAIIEPVDVAFRPAGEGGEAPMDEDAAADEEPPEALVDGTVDLGALATEFLILGIDPYPRKPGAVFDPPMADPGREGPFAALAKLKDRRK